MTMIEVLKKDYWSRADAFLLPLTGLTKTDKFEMQSHLFWNEYSIYNYNLVISLCHEDKEELNDYCRAFIFPTLDKKGYLVESYDIGCKSVFILDIAEWAKDIQTFLEGKYSRFTSPAKSAIEKYHTFNHNKIPIHIYAVLHPSTEMALLDDMTPIEYICQPETYGLNLEVISKIGEIGSIYDRLSETLLTDVDHLCKSDVE